MRWTREDERRLRAQANDELIEVAHFSLGRMTKKQQREFLAPRRREAKRAKRQGKEDHATD